MAIRIMIMTSGEEEKVPITLVSDEPIGICTYRLFNGAGDEVASGEITDVRPPADRVLWWIAYVEIEGSFTPGDYEVVVVPKQWRETKRFRVYPPG